MNKILLKSQIEYENQGYKLFFFNEELFLANTENFEAIIKFIKKHYSCEVLDTLIVADIDARMLKIEGEIIIFKDSGDFVFMVNETKKTGGIINDIYKTLSTKIDIQPLWK